jgi:hypothetical protein
MTFAPCGSEAQQNRTPPLRMAQAEFFFLLTKSLFKHRSVCKPRIVQTSNTQILNSARLHSGRGRRSSIVISGAQIRAARRLLDWIVGNPTEEPKCRVAHFSCEAGLDHVERRTLAQHSSRSENARSNLPSRQFELSTLSASAFHCSADRSFTRLLGGVARRYSSITVGGDPNTVVQKGEADRGDQRTR